MLPSLAKHVNSAARGTRQWQQRRQPQCHARSAALRYHRSAISLPQPPQPRTPSVLLFSPPPSCRLLTAPSPGGGVLLPHPTSFSISRRTAAATGPFCRTQISSDLCRNFAKGFDHFSVFRDDKFHGILFPASPKGRRTTSLRCGGTEDAKGKREARHTSF